MSSLIAKQIPGDAHSSATDLKAEQQQQQGAAPALQGDDGNNSTAAADNHQPQEPVCQDKEAAAQPVEQQPQQNHTVQLAAVHRQRSPFSEFGSNQTHYSPTDPDAKVSVKPGKPSQLNYL